jgi:hypothetical protein
MHKVTFLGLLLLTVSARCCHRSGHVPPPPANPVQDIFYNVLDSRQKGLLLAYPGVNAANAQTFWTNSLDLSQRVEFAGGVYAIEKIENAHKWKAIISVTNIHGSDPNAPSEQQFNNEVVWDKDAATHFEKLPCWSEHIALLHPGQYGYQENRDGNPFLGIVVLFDEKPANPNQPGGQFHIGFRSWFGHYEPENGDIGNTENYQLYERWYGLIDSFVPHP